MSSNIITQNLNDEFNRMKKTAHVNRTLNGRIPSGVTIGPSSIIDKNNLPKRIQRKMASAARADIKMGNASFYHPLFQTTNMMLPRDRRERNEWCRHFYRTEPIIATSLDLHTEYPISDFNNECEDSTIKDFFDYMAFDRLDIINLLLDVGLEYWKLGDVFPFGQLNEDEGMWDRFVILNPDFIDIKGSVLAEEPIIELIPDDQVKAIVQSGAKGEYGDIFNQLSADVVRSVKSGRNIRLDNRLVSHISHKASQYEMWGTPILMRCFKTLIYKDRLRQAQDAIASRHITPIRVAKVGNPGEPMPTQEEIDSLRDTLLEADQDPNFFLVYHYALSFDYVGSSGHILPLNQEFDFIQKELMNGLGINQALLNGEGPTYANAQVGMDALARRYMSYRLRLESWIKYKIYKPIAEIQGFYKPIKSEINGGYRIANRKDRQLIIPDIRWQQEDLTSNQAIMNFIQQMQGKNLISMHTILPMIGLNPEIEEANLQKERGTVFDPNAPKDMAPRPAGGPPSPGKQDLPIPSNDKSAPAPAPSPSDTGDTTKETSLKDFFEKRGSMEVSSNNREQVEIITMDTK